ncbi:MAG TPA: DUF6328 family protein [Micromonosporaceae bacterium]|nr:DUF6328 family protein [Micromonosporaceae bacterium]
MAREAAKQASTGGQAGVGPNGGSGNGGNGGNGDSEETEAERLNRNFTDLLQELRVAQTGIQILFAFLLTLAFTNRFQDIDDFDRTTYLVALLAAAGAAALIIAPVAYHRMMFRQGRKPELVRSAHRMASGGLAFLLVSMVGSVLLVADVAVGRTGAVIVASATAVWFVLLWFVLPLVRRTGDDGDEDS